MRMLRTPMMPSNCTCDARKSREPCDPCKAVADKTAERNARILALADNNW